MPDAGIRPNAQCRRGMRDAGEELRFEFGCGMRGFDEGFRVRTSHRLHMTDVSIPPFSQWVTGADRSRSGDPLWSVQAYRFSLYAVDCHTFDRRANAELRKAAALDQLTRAVGSISANIAEGYSRSSIADRTRFYGYALGSTREAIAWYDSLKIELGDRVEDRLAILIQIRRLLLTTLRNARPEGTVVAMRDSLRKTENSDP